MRHPKFQNHPRAGPHPRNRSSGASTGGAPGFWLRLHCSSVIFRFLMDTELGATETSSSSILNSKSEVDGTTKYASMSFHSVQVTLVVLLSTHFPAAMSFAT